LSWRRFGIWGSALALLVTFFLSGLWHGVTWCFVVWGLLHGIYLATNTVLAAKRSRMPGRRGTIRRIVQVLLTFHLVVLAWVFFRATSLTSAIIVLTSIGRSTRGLEVLMTAGGSRAVLVTLLSCLVYAGIEAARGSVLWHGVERNVLLRWSAYFMLCGAIFVLGQPATGYIYFQF